MRFAQAVSVAIVAALLLLLARSAQTAGSPGLTGAQFAPASAKALQTRGPRGPRGYRGPRGPRGIQGPPGAAGAPGAPGQPGQPGLPGARGPTGSHGATGMRGVTGMSGVTGTTGPTGPSDGYFKHALNSVGLNGAVGDTAVLAINVPAGSYMLSATVRVTGSGSGATTPRCYLGTSVDISLAASVPLAISEKKFMTVAWATTIGSAGSVTLYCGDAGAGTPSVDLRSISAIKLGTLTVQ